MVSRLGYRVNWLDHMRDMLCYIRRVEINWRVIVSEESKLLRALIDALGFEVEEKVKEVPYTYRTAAIIGPIDPDTGLHRNTPSVEMSLTKRVTEYKLTRRSNYERA